MSYPSVLPILLLLSPLALHAEPASRAATGLKPLKSVDGVELAALDVEKLTLEDAQDKLEGRAPRFALPVAVDITVESAGSFERLGDGRWIWRYRVETPDAASLNFGFGEFKLPAESEMWLYTADYSVVRGPFTAADNDDHGQFWSPVLLGSKAVIEIVMTDRARASMRLRLTQIGHGYRYFGQHSKYCKSGACNMDVACLGADDPWQQPRRAVAAIGTGGSRFCTASLLNNTSGDRRMLVATATHCGITAANAASLVTYWNFDAPTCRRPGSPESGSSAVVGPLNQFNTGAIFRMATNNPFSGSTPAPTRSDFTLVEMDDPANPTHNLYWAGWDARSADPQCSPGNQCASIHHPDGDEKRITFVEESMFTDNISGANGVHWRVRWDPTPPFLPNIPGGPGALPPGVTEPGSSGSPVYSAQRRLVGVLSGGPSACGATGANLSDLYGKLAHAWEGLGTPATRARDWLDPTGTGALFIDGRGQCTPPAVPAQPTVSATAANQLTVSWPAVSGASRYRIYRAIGACPGTGSVQIGETTGLSFVDNDVSGQITYSYRVSAYADGDQCESAASVCQSATATGACNLAPTFAGLATALSSGTTMCGIDLDAAPATAACGRPQDLVYNYYRSTTPGFTPGPATLLRSCLRTLGIQDHTALPGQEYEYVVRAEDLAATGTGQCGGREESNTVRRRATAAGPLAVLLFDDVEGGANFIAGGTGGAGFSIVETGAYSPIRAWFVPDPTGTSDRTLTTPAPIAIDAGGFRLSFFHRYATEATYDGGVLEYSLDGVSYVDILAGTGPVAANPSRFIQGAYPTAPLIGAGPLGGRRAWNGTQSTYTQMIVDLTEFSGRNVWFRARFGSDASVGGQGWWIDDIQIDAPTACQTGLNPLIFRGTFDPLL